MSTMSWRFSALLNRCPHIAKSIAALLAVFLLQGCTFLRQPGGLKTNLGPMGNEDVANRFREYRVKRASVGGCTPNTSAPKVIITGFGLFSGVEYNISGVVAQTFANPSFTPEDLSLTASDPIGQTGAVGPGRIPESAKGAVASLRHMTIKGKEYEICFLALDVIWDLAAAIISLEAESFQPQLIVMMGRGGLQATFEGGAVNDAMLGASGFTSEGTSSHTNTPVESPILPGQPFELPMTWNNQHLASLTRSTIESMGYTVTFAEAARPSNNYICNNVSYVVLSAAQSQELNLAGGKIRWTPRILSQPKVGFFHLPSAATNERRQVAKWIRILASVIDSELSAP